MIDDRLIYVAPSPIHGKGLFAARRIDEGDLIGTYRGIKTRVDGPHVLWIYEGNVAVGRRGTNDLRFVNHSDEPNAQFDGFDLYATQVISRGEEITIDYSAADEED